MNKTTILTGSPLGVFSKVANLVGVRPCSEKEADEMIKKNDLPETPDPLNLCACQIPSETIFETVPVFATLMAAAAPKTRIQPQPEMTRILDALSEALESERVLLSGQSIGDEEFSCTVITANTEDVATVLQDDVIVILGKDVRCNKIQCDVLVAVDSNITAGTISVDKHAVINAESLAARRINIRDGVVAVNELTMNRFDSDNVRVFTTVPLVIGGDKVVEPAIVGSIWAYDVQEVDNSLQELLSVLKKNAPKDEDWNKLRAHIHPYGLIPHGDNVKEGVGPTPMSKPEHMAQPADASAEHTETTETASASVVQTQVYNLTEADIAMMAKIPNAQLDGFIRQFLPCHESGMSKKELIAIIRTLAATMPQVGLAIEQIKQSMTATESAPKETPAPAPEQTHETPPAPAEAQ